MTQTTHQTSGPLLTGAEVMAVLKCDRNALYELRQSGALDFVRLTPRRFRYPDASVRALIAGRTPAAQDDGRARRGRRAPAA